MIIRDLTAEEQHLEKVLRSERFRLKEGLSNEVPFFIYPYPPHRELEVSEMRRRLVTRLQTNPPQVRVLEINLYDLSVQVLKERSGDVWGRLLESEPGQDKQDFLDLLQGMLDPERHLAPTVRRVVDGREYDVVLLSGIAEVFPYIRSHNVLNNLQSVVTDCPLLVFFPGSYKQSDTVGSSLVLFDRLRDDQYYRAKNILSQEA